MEAPDYLICIDCETPCYTFEWEETGPSEVMCMACGNDEVEQFMTEEDFEAMQAAASGVWMYGDPENHDLKRALADHLGVAPENIVVGEGIDALLGYLVLLERRIRHK